MPACRNAALRYAGMECPCDCHYVGRTCRWAFHAQLISEVICSVKQLVELNLCTIFRLKFVMRFSCLLILCSILILSCSKRKPARDIPQAGELNKSFLDSLSYRTFSFFWDLADSAT